jgi:hypothetical protein
VNQDDAILDLTMSSLANQPPAKLRAFLIPGFFDKYPTPTTPPRLFLFHQQLLYTSTSFAHSHICFCKALQHIRICIICNFTHTHKFKMSSTELDQLPDLVASAGSGMALSDLISHTVMSVS